MITLAGSLLEGSFSLIWWVGYAIVDRDPDYVVVGEGRTISFEFNYKDVSQRKKLWQNIELKPGDTLVVP